MNVCTGRIFKTLNHGQGKDTNESKWMLVQGWKTLLCLVLTLVAKLWKSRRPKKGVGCGAAENTIHEKQQSVSIS